MNTYKIDENRDSRFYPPRVRYGVLINGQRVMQSRWYRQFKTREDAERYVEKHRTASSASEVRK